MKRLILTLALILAPFSAAMAATLIEFSPNGSTLSIDGTAITLSNTLAEDLLYPTNDYSVPAHQYSGTFLIEGQQFSYRYDVWGGAASDLLWLTSDTPYFTVDTVLLSPEGSTRTVYAVQVGTIPSPVPLPASALLMLGAMALPLAWRRRV